MLKIWKVFCDRIEIKIYLFYYINIIFKTYHHNKINLDQIQILNFISENESCL